MQVIALAGTPVSVRRSVNQFVCEAFWKNKVPVPLLGTPKLKLVPTWVQLPVQTGSLMMMVGSGMESANAAVAQHSTIAHAINANNRFIKPPCRTCRRRTGQRGRLLNPTNALPDGGSGVLQVSTCQSESQEHSGRNPVQKSTMMK